MNATPIWRHHSVIETVGQWLALLCALSLLHAALYVGPSVLGSLPFDTRLFEKFFGAWQRAMIRQTPLIVLLAVVPQWLPQRRVWRWPLLALTVLASVGLGWGAGQLWLLQICGCQRLPTANDLAIVHDLIVRAVVLTIVVEYRRRFITASRTLHEARIVQLRLEREVAIARLQLLQAQIEPHFLFNSLANVRRLLRVDGEVGRAMLADLLGYLESALPRLRHETPTLEREVEIVRAFLGVHQVRMGSRLSVGFDVPVELGQQVVPPMMLLTLVENALKHGLQPLHEGGSIRIAASADAHSLRVDVADTGCGLGSSLGAGTGLANIRARLRAMYGSAASLSLRVNEPRGVVASIEFPLAAA